MHTGQPPSPGRADRPSAGPSRLSLVAATETGSHPEEPDSAAGTAAGGDAAAERPAGALYQLHAVGMIRLAVVTLGDRPAAEDVVQEAFCGLYRRWDQPDKPDRALQYVRSSVLNGCRSQLRSRLRNARRAAKLAPDSSPSAEHHALIHEEHREVLAALRRLPDRQREVLVLRFFLDLPDPEIAQSMGISQGTVK